MDTTGLESFVKTCKDTGRAAKAEEKATAAAAVKTKNRIKEVFKRWDGDGNGVLSRQEMQKLMRSLGGSISKEEIDKVYEEVDTNGNDELDLDEFVEWVMAPGSRLQVQADGKVLGFDLALALRPLFHVYDLDHNGSISSEEFAEVHHILQGAIHAHERGHAEQGESCERPAWSCGQELELVFEAGDEDKSRRIDFDEFVEWQREAVMKAGISKDRLVDLISRLSALLEAVACMEHTMSGGAVVKVIAPMKNQIAQISSMLYPADDEDATQQHKKRWEAFPAHMCTQTLLRRHMKIPVPTYNVDKIDFIVKPCIPALEHRRLPGHHHRWLANVLRRVQHKPRNVVDRSVSDKRKHSSNHKVKPHTKAKAQEFRSERSAGDVAATAEPAVPDELDDQAAEPLAGSSQEQEGLVTVSHHYYAFEENPLTGVLQWRPLENGCEYIEALTALSPNIHILATIATEANFDVCSWAALHSALSKAVESGLVDEEQWQGSKDELTSFAEHQIAKSHLGFDQLSVELRQQSTKHFFENDFKYTPLQVMNMLTDTGLVGLSPEWEGDGAPEWNEFEAARIAQGLFG